MRRLAAAVVVGAAIGAGVVAMLARGDKVPLAAPAEEAGLVVENSFVRPGRIVLLARNDRAEPIRIAQVLVNDAFVDFHAQRLTVAPSGKTHVTVHYPWVEGESYEIDLLTVTGAIVEYEVEDAGET